MLGMSFEKRTLRNTPALQLCGARVCNSLGGCSWALGLPCWMFPAWAVQEQPGVLTRVTLLRDLLCFSLLKEETWFPNCLILASINLLEQNCCFSTSPTFQAVKLEAGGLHPVFWLLSHSSGVFIKTVLFSPALPGATDLYHQAAWFPMAL